MFSSVPFLKRHGIVLIVCLVVLIGAGQGGVKSATGASSDVVVCVNTKSGVMRQAAKAKCGKTERIVRLSSAATSTPTSSQVVVCVDKKSGVLRQTGKAKCGKTERILRLSIGATSPSATGSQGPTGATGPAGARGLAGATGPAGSAGDAGKKGNTGAIGPAGSAGDTGLLGLQGGTGIQGLIGPTGPGTQWRQLGGSSLSGLTSTPFVLPSLEPFGIECYKVSGVSRYVLKMVASVTESMYLTVSKIGVENSSSTYYLHDSALSQVGGERTTNDVWRISVFTVNSPAANLLKKQYIVDVNIGLDNCGASILETY